MLKDKIQGDLQAAMMARDAAKLSAIRMLKSAIQYYEIQKGGAGYQATNEDVLDVVSKEIKKRKESIDLYKQGGRQESADSEQKEVDILQSYLPEQMGEEEIRVLVAEAVRQTGASDPQDMGKVMETLMPKVKGRADSTLVSNLVRESLL